MTDFESFVNDHLRVLAEYKTFFDQEANFNRAGTIKLASGKYLSCLDPQPDQFDLMDIIIGLSRLPRFAGQLKRNYSVLEHSIHVFNLCKSVLPHAFHLHKLCSVHESGEGLGLGDMPSPFKKNLPQYKIMETKINEAAFLKFAIPVDAAMYEKMKVFDRMMFDLEYLHFHELRECTMIQHWDEHQAVEQFLLQCGHLFKDHL